MQEISLEQLREAIQEKFGRDDVVVVLTQKGGWVFDPTATQLQGAQAHDRWLIGRMSRQHFDVAERNPEKAPWGQLEVREEPTAPLSTDGTRIVGYVRVEVATSTGRVRVKPSSLSNGQVSRQPGDQSVGFFRTNPARIDGEVEVLKQAVEAEDGDGWKAVVEVYQGGDHRLITPLVMAGIFPTQQ